MTLQNVMEGHAFYNNNSLSQHAADTQAIPDLREAAAVVPLPADAPVVIADYGCSQGANSLEPMRVCIDALGERTSAPVAVYHIDLPSNDFTALFETVQRSAHTYLREGVFTFACGRSFYEAVLPPHTASLAFCGCAVHWLNGLPCAVPRHVWPHAASPEVLAAWREQAVRDYQRFLDLRARELRVGGQMVVAAGMQDEHGYVGPERDLDVFNEIVQALVAEGRVREAEYDRLIIPAYFRTYDEFCVPFGQGGFQGEQGERLELLGAVVLKVPTVMLEQYQLDHDAAAYGRRQAGFLRGWSAGIFRQHLDPDRSREEVDRLLDEVYARVATRFATDPERWEPRWTQIVMRIGRTA